MNLTQYDEADPTTYDVVRVTADDLSTVSGHGTILTVTGTSTDGAERIAFGMDHRAGREFLAAVCDQGEADAWVADYQIQSVEQPELEA